MFRIGVFELGITCGVFLLLMIVPWIISRGYSKINKRLDDIEKKIKKKK